MVLSVALIACGGDDDGDGDGNGGTVDSGITIADSAPTADAPPVAGGCDFTEPVQEPSQWLGFADVQGADNNPENPDAPVVSAGALLSAQGEPLDILGVDLWDTFGAFSEGGIVTGTYEITGDETAFATCGVCISLVADIPGAGQPPSQTLLANGGSLEVTEVGTEVGDTFAATLSGVTLREITVDGEGNQTDVPNGCTTSLPNLSFSVTLQDPNAGP